MITLKTAEEISLLAASGKILAEILKQLARAVKPGVATKDLDKLAQKLVFSFQRKYPAAEIRPSFLGYRGFPAQVCISVNEEVVHGLPSGRILKEGDIAGLDFGISYNGWHTDSAVTVGVGSISAEARRLLKITAKALEKGIKEARAGKTLGDIGWAVQREAEKNGLAVIKELVGHGIGRQLHEEPYVPNWGQRGQGLKLEPGMVLAVEPMFNLGTADIVLAADGWTYKTADGKLSAHFEHTVAVTSAGPKVLTR